MKINKKKHREEYLLDHHHTNINEEGEEQVQNKKKIINSIQRKLQRNQSFRYVSKHIGKGVKGSLKRLYIVNENGEIVKTHIDKETIEEQIQNHKVKHFTKAHSSKMYKDKIYAELNNPQIRDKILNRDLDRGECNSQKV